MRANPTRPEAAVWKLALTVDGRGGEALLDSYDAERLPVTTG